MQQYREAMSRALFLANRASAAGDVPVGAVVVDPLGNVIGEGWNVREAHHDPTGHAEIVALRQAGERLKRWNLVGCTLVVTLEPCTMCAGAAAGARVDRVVFGAWEPKTGAAGSLRDVLRDSRMGHEIEVVPGVLAQEASAQLTAFFEECRRREGLKGRVPAVAPASFDEEGVSSRRVRDALHAAVARTPRAWEGENSGKVSSRVRPDDALMPVEWDDEARLKYGKLPRVPQLERRPRYGSLTRSELRSLEAQRKGIAVESLPVELSHYEEEIAPSAVVSSMAAADESPALQGLPPELRSVIAGIAARRRR